MESFLKNNKAHLYHLLLLVTLSSTLAVKERCHPQDKAALLAIQKSFDNGTAFPSWNPENDCCRFWDGVKCDSVTHRINHLSIVGVNGIPSTLTGVIPDAVGDLTGLTLLRFHKNQNVTGTIPSTVTRLQNLIFADFSWNSLSGPVPTFFHHMRNLRFLDLSFNWFSGSLPPALVLGPAIASIDLSRNMLTGSIPDGFGSIRTTGISLMLSNNRLTGQIPNSLEKVQFANIDFSRNEFTGDAAFLFENGSHMQEVDLSRNMLSFNMSSVDLGLRFPIPTDLRLAEASLITLDVSHNEIFGSLPASLEVQNLQFLNVSYNRLCGQIPTGGKLSSFDQSSYVHNKCLCGTPLSACQ